MPQVKDSFAAEITIWKDEAYAQEVNRRSTAQLLSGKAYLISDTSPYQIRLDEKPNEEAKVSIAGYTEVAYQPTQSGEFYVDYVTGYITFRVSDKAKVVEPVYMGWGSLVDAPDINQLREESEAGKPLYSAFAGFAFNPVRKAVGLNPGRGWIGHTRVDFLGNYNVDFGVGGAFQIAAMTANYYNKILLVVTSAGVAKKYEGTPAASAANVVDPAMPLGEIPCCLVTVQDDGTGGAGTIKTIAQSDITNYRPLWRVPSVQYTQVSLYLAGLPYLGQVVDGYRPVKKITVIRATIMAVAAPTGSAVQIELWKNGVTTNQILRLSLNKTYEETTLSSPVQFLTTDRIGLNVTTADTNGVAEGLNIILDCRIEEP